MPVHPMNWLKGGTRQVSESVALSQCVHYRGWRYGGFGNNLYEDYLVALCKGGAVGHARRELVARLLASNNNDFGSALGVVLSRNYRPWVFPWSVGAAMPSLGKPQPLRAQENPDIVCHYAVDGVLCSHINREFLWLEGALRNMKGGYLPDQFGYVNLLELRRSSEARYLVLDGNHRISALHALGHSEVVARIVRRPWLKAEAVRWWPAVWLGRYSGADAAKILDRYFWCHNPPLGSAPVQRLVEDERLNLEG